MSSNPIATKLSRNYFSRSIMLLCLCAALMTGAAELVASDAYGLADMDLVAQKAERVARLEASGVFTNDQILADFPDSVRESDAIGIKAGAGVVSLPTNVGKLFFADGLDPDESNSYELILIIDSLVVSGEVVLPDEMNLIGVQIDSTLLHALLADNVLSLARRIPGSIPGETFSVWGVDGEVTYDLSMFYKVQYQPSRSVNDIKSELESLSILDEVYCQSWKRWRFSKRCTTSASRSNATTDQRQSWNHVRSTSQCLMTSGISGQTAVSMQQALGAVSATRSSGMTASPSRSSITTSVRPSILISRATSIRAVGSK